MLFPLHDLPDAPARVQVGFLALILGAAWLLSGILLRRWAGGGQSRLGVLRAFAADRDWRWLGAIFIIGGLAVARPWGMSSGPFVWVRHTGLLLLVILIAELAATRQRRDIWVSIPVIFGLLVYSAISLRVVIRYSQPDLAGLSLLSAPWLDHGLLYIAAATAGAALLAGLAHAARHFRQTAPIPALLMVLLLPVLAEGTMLAGAMDKFSRINSHENALDGFFRGESRPAGIFKMPVPCDGNTTILTQMPNLPSELDHSGCHKGPQD